MCLYVKSNAEVRTADKPILVWKFVNEDRYNPDIWLSPYYPHVDGFHKYGELVIAKKITSRNEQQPIEDFEFEPIYHSKYNNFWAWLKVDLSQRDFVENPKKKAIYAGLHAIRSKHKAKNGKTAGAVVCPAIIPVGAKYVKGKRKEIVSTQLIVCKTLEEAKRIMDEQKGE